VIERELEIGLGRMISLLHFDGANNGTVFTDLTGKTWTRTGSGVTSTAAAKFGATSYRQTASGSRLSLLAANPGNAEFNFGADDCTIDCWINPINYTSPRYPGIFAKRTANANTAGGMAFHCGATSGGGSSRIGAQSHWTG